MKSALQSLPPSSKPTFEELVWDVQFSFETSQRFTQQLNSISCGVLPEISNLLNFSSVLSLTARK
jgi:hypothetical protein